MRGTDEAMEDPSLLRQRCEGFARRLPIPQPFNAQAFVDAVAEHRGRPIELVGIVAKQDTPCGIFIATAEVDYIFYSSNTTLLHQEHIIAHEVAHILCDHKGTSALRESVAALLMKDLSLRLINRVLGRTVYSDIDEAEAEMLASVILIRAGRDRVTPQVSPELAEGLNRLGSAFR
jgi:IrrE N-terminal-like domain